MYSRNRSIANLCFIFHAGLYEVKHDPMQGLIISHLLDNQVRKSVIESKSVTGVILNTSKESTSMLFISPPDIREKTSLRVQTGGQDENTFASWCEYHR